MNDAATPDQRDRFIVFHLPDTPELLAAIGKVSLRHAHLDHQLRLLIKTLARVSVATARLATMGYMSRKLREEALRLGRQEMRGNGRALLQLQALLNECKLVSEERNDLIHGICAREVNADAVSDDEMFGEMMMLDESLRERPMPTTEQLEDLQQRIGALVNRINEERRHGFIAEAMALNPDRAEIPR